VFVTFNKFKSVDLSTRGYAWIYFPQAISSWCIGNGGPYDITAENESGTEYEASGTTSYYTFSMKASILKLEYVSGETTVQVKYW